MLDISKTFTAKYNVAQLRAILKMLLPVSTYPEQEAIRSFLSRPSEDLMRYFVYNFWKSRNSKDPGKAWDNYADLVREVNKLFGKGASPGYETERGMVYLKYGKPNARITVEGETGSLPYEVWQYNAPGQQSRPGVFLFYMPGYMVNDFRLLHSTVTGEISNIAWRSLLYTSGQNPGARAEQYLQ